MWTSTEDGIAKRRGVNRGKTLQSPRSRSCPLWEHWCLSWEHFTWCQMRSLVIFKWVRGDQGGGWMWSSPLPKNRSKLHVEQFSQNTHWMLAEELITTKTQERLPCNWVKIKVFFKKIASVPLGGSCESGGVPPLWEPPSQWEEISGDRQGASEESAATSLQEAEWRDTSIPGSDHLHALPYTHCLDCPQCALAISWWGAWLVWQWLEPALDVQQDLLFDITDPSAPSCWNRCSLIYFWAAGWGRWDGSTYAGRGASEYSSTGGVHQQELICWCKWGLGAKSQASVDTWWEGWGWLYRVSLKGLGCGPDQNWEECAKRSTSPPQKPHCYHTHVRKSQGPTTAAASSASSPWAGLHLCNYWEQQAVAPNVEAGLNLSPVLWLYDVGGFMLLVPL